MAAAIPGEMVKPPLPYAQIHSAFSHRPHLRSTAAAMPVRRAPYFRGSEAATEWSGYFRCCCHSPSLLVVQQYALLVPASKVYVIGWMKDKEPFVSSSTIEGIADLTFDSFLFKFSARWAGRDAVDFGGPGGASLA